MTNVQSVSTHSRAEAAAQSIQYFFDVIAVSTHSRAEAAAHVLSKIAVSNPVSTHSRAEAAAQMMSSERGIYCGFNTQPRGGGCLFAILNQVVQNCFNTQPRGGGCLPPCLTSCIKLCFNTQPRGGGCNLSYKRINDVFYVSTHSRAEAAAVIYLIIVYDLLFQHTAARRRLLVTDRNLESILQVFQHTAARRRLLPPEQATQPPPLFQHTAARRRLRY